MASGFWSGALCGCLVGGLLAGRFGFDAVFLLGAAIFSAAAALVALIRPAGAGRPAAAGEAAGTAGPSGPEGTAGTAGPSVAGPAPAVPGGLGVLLAGRGVLPALALGCLPLAAATAGLANLLLPVHLSALGYGPSMISRLDAVALLTVMLLGPLAGRFPDLSPGAFRMMAAASLLAALSGPCLLLRPTLGGAVLAMALLGLARAAAGTVRPPVPPGPPGSDPAGGLRSRAYFSSMILLGMAAGPPLVGAAWGGWGLAGVTVLGAAWAAAGLALLAAAGGRRPGWPAGSSG
jgi:hypothetical protein